MLRKPLYVRNNGYKKPSLDLLVRPADLYGVTTDYLLGHPVPSMSPKLEYAPVSPDALPTLHGYSVWDAHYGGGLVNSMERQIHFLGGKMLPFADATGVSTLVQAYIIGYQPTCPPPSLEAVSQSEGALWVVPIGLSVKIQTELQG